MFILENGVCEAAIVLHCTKKCLCYFVHPYINKDRLNKRNNSLRKLHYPLYERRSYHRTVVFHCISFCQVYLMNCQLSVQTHESCSSPAYMQQIHYWIKSLHLKICFCLYYWYLLGYSLNTRYIFLQSITNFGMKFEYLHLVDAPLNFLYCHKCLQSIWKIFIPLHCFYMKLHLKLFYIFSINIHTIAHNDKVKKIFRIFCKFIVDYCVYVEGVKLLNVLIC